MTGPLGALLGLAVACAGPGTELTQTAGPGTLATSAPTPPPPPPASPETPQGDPPVVGAWQSDSCEGRTWPRALLLSADQSWQGRDLVSPCPPGVTCIWSGIVEYQGTWRPASPGYALELADRTPGGPGAMDPPTRVVPDGDALVDDLGCRYQRVPALP